MILTVNARKMLTPALKWSSYESVGTEDVPRISKYRGFKPCSLGNGAPPKKAEA